MDNPKSSSVAGILGIFLGAFGVHDWYLGRRKKQAKTHVTLTIVAVVLFAVVMIMRAVASSGLPLAAITILNNVATVLYVIAWLMIMGNIIWGAIEGIIILAQGDAGLAARGYVVAKSSDEAATPASSANPAANMTPAQTPVSTNQATPPPSTSVTLPPAPTLAQQASNTAQPQPVVFHSSNIKQFVPSGALGQAVSSDDVDLPALTVPGDNGKATLNPRILRVATIAVVAVIAIVAIVFSIKGGIDSTIGASYSATYRVAKELKPRLENASKAPSCRYVLDYVNIATVDQKTYSGYVNNCQSLVTDVGGLINQLGETPGIEQNTELNAKFREFKDLYDSTFPSTEQVANLTETLKLYQSWHDYVLAVDPLTIESPDAEFQRAADILRTSGNSTLIQYGESWLARELDYLKSYRTYWDASYEDPNKDALRTEMETQRDNLKNWIADHRPDVTTLMPLAIPDVQPLYQKYVEFYDLLKEIYQEHYDYNSNDCNVAGQKVYCQ